MSLPTSRLPDSWDRLKCKESSEGGIPADSPEVAKIIAKVRDASKREGVYAAAAANAVRAKMATKPALPERAGMPLRKVCLEPGCTVAVLSNRQRCQPHADAQRLKRKREHNAKKRQEKIDAGKESECRSMK